MGLEIRFYKRTKDCLVSGYIIQTPFDDTEDAIKFAEERFKREVKTKNWKLDKGFIKKQIMEEKNRLLTEEEALAREIYIVLIGNPERYKYISNLMKCKGDKIGITQEQANEKNRNKAVLLAKYFYANPNLKRP